MRSRWAPWGTAVLGDRERVLSSEVVCRWKGWRWRGKGEVDGEGEGEAEGCCRAEGDSRDEAARRRRETAAVRWLFGLAVEARVAEGKLKGDGVEVAGGSRRGGVAVPDVDAGDWSRGGRGDIV